jgi:DNA polymerase-3 subunit beta
MARGKKHTAEQIVNLLRQVEVAAAERASDSRGTPPILSHLLLDAKDGVLAITGCDLKRRLRSECPAEVKVAGKAAVSAQKFLSYLKVLPKGRIAVKLLENQHLQVHAGPSRTRMPGRNPADFPAIPEPAADVVRLSSRALKTVLRQTVFAVATTGQRYLLNAALLLLRVNRMGMVATDGGCRWSRWRTRRPWSKARPRRGPCSQGVPSAPVSEGGIGRSLGFP